MQSRTFHVVGAVFLLGAWLAIGSRAFAQVNAGATPGPAPAGKSEKKQAADDSLVIRVYPVTDMTAPKPDHRFRGTMVPDMELGGNPAAAAGEGGGTGGMGVMMGAMSGMGGMGMGGMGGMGMGGMGMGAPAGGAPPGQTPKPAAGPHLPGPGLAPSARPTSDQSGFSIADLAQTIRETIAPESWREAGGPGSLTTLGGMLIVNQTPAVQEQIAQFLKQIQTAGEEQRSVVVRAWWLFLDQKQLADLTSRPAGKTGPIDRAALADLVGKTKGYQGEITCFDGQTVYLVSGRSRSLIVSAIPVVGGPVGYQPVHRNPQTGALLQVTPQLLPAGQTAVVDLQSLVVRPDATNERMPFFTSDTASGVKTPENKEASPPPSQFTLNLDRVNFVVQQLATTIRLHLGQPALVGGLTFEPGASSKEEGDRQLYLFIEVTAK